MNPLSELLFKPQFPRPVVNHISQTAARALTNGYRWRHKPEKILLRWVPGTNSTTHYFYKQELIMALLHVDAARPRTFFRWFYFREPSEGLSLKVVDRINGVCLYNHLPTLHKIKRVWIWSDFHPWTGNRLILAPTEFSLKQTLERYLTHEWI